MLNKFQEEFKRNIENISQRVGHPCDIFNDNVSCIAYALSNSCDIVRKEKREAAYLDIVKRYRKEDVEVFPL